VRIIIRLPDEEVVRHRKIVRDIEDMLCDCGIRYNEIIVEESVTIAEHKRKYQNDRSS
jgi:hypothetical protein